MASRTLSIGATGEDVRNLQKLVNYHLSARRPAVTVDGKFGPKTKADVVLFQTVNQMNPSGIVDSLTMQALLDVRTVSAKADVKPPPAPATSTFPTPSVKLTPPSILQPKPDPFRPPAPKLTPPSYSLTLQAGAQTSFNPWFFSPLVITAQLDILIKNDGKPPFTISTGGQFALNSSVGGGQSPGSWTGQGFVQMGPNIAQGKFGTRLDLLNPFVQYMVQKTDTQHWVAGFAVGNQSNWTILRTKDKAGEDVDILTLFVNAQEVFTVDLTNGKAGAPASQVLLGVSHSFNLF